MTGIVAAAAASAAQQGGGGSGATGFHVVAAPALAHSISIISPTVTATATGGSSPYTYQWSFKSGIGVYITAPTSAATTFTCFGSTSRDAIAICTVKDNAGKVAVSNDVAILLLDGGTT